MFSKAKTAEFQTLFAPSACAKTANTVNRTLVLEAQQPELEANHSLTCLLLLLKNIGP